jgi:large subunit ribosomal protein L22
MAATETRTEVRAVAKWVRSSPRKARLVVDQIRGRTVPEARTILAFTPRAAARDIEKVLRSAVANAEANHNLVGDSLYVSSAHVDEGPVIKRWRARARGRVARIRKPTCHITIHLAPLSAEAPSAPAAAAARATVQAPPEQAAPEETPAEEAAPEESAPDEPAAGEPGADETAAEGPPTEEPAAEEKPRRRRRKKSEEES